MTRRNGGDRRFGGLCPKCAAFPAMLEALALALALTRPLASNAPCVTFTRSSPGAIATQAAIHAKIEAALAAAHGGGV